ncbi:MAG TPA: hypothetical protein VH247_15830 [Thermoleophilaceae bacterium]|nr:hypothetical protein [Thermoleophilaceae bacterium]
MRLKLLIVLCIFAVPASAQAARIQLGLAGQPGGAAAMRKTAPFGYRYQYLAGGVNTGNGWSTWNENGTFVTRYIDESRKARITPVFTYYMIRQSHPGSENGDEAKAEIGNLRNAQTMNAYWADLMLFFKRAGSTHRRVLLHVEPDMWGYLEQAGATRLARAFARHVARLRNRYARNVALGYQLSVWGTKTDIAVQDPRLREVDRLARKAAAFYKSLRTHFDFVFGEFSDRDSGFKEHIYGQSHKDAWWTKKDFTRHVRFLARFHRMVRRPIFLWQIPLGNTSLPDTWGRFRDNRPQWLLGRGSAAHRKAYARAGVRALLFGGGADGTTSERTDGGWFLRHAAAYYRR